QPPKVNPELQRAVDAAAPESQIEVVVDVADGTGGLQSDLDRLVAKGSIRTRTDYEQARQRLRANEAARNSRLLEPVVVAVQERGGTVLYRCQNLPCLNLRLPATAVAELARRTDVVEIDVERTAIEAGMSGTEVRTGTQGRQFLENPFHFDGNGKNEVNESDNVVVAVAEPGGGYPDHDGYRENTANYFRYGTGTDSTGKWECDADGCDSVTSFSKLSSHAAGAAGLLFGDLVDGQIPSVPAGEREGGSGYAPEARSHLYYFNDGTGSAVQVFDHLAGLEADQQVPELVSNSWGFLESPRCSGASSTSRAANRLYRDGIGVFSAAHNRGGSPTACEVTAPGSAIGSFTVGAHMELREQDPAELDPADATTVRTAPIYVENDGTNASSWGGNSTQGQRRSLVSITGPGTRTDKFTASGGLSDTGVICCTSMATPTVAGHAASFMDFYRSTYGNFIDDPGVLYSNMLLMGDRQTVNGKTTGSPDHRWGTGRLRMRKPDSKGLDAPYAYFTGWTCVSDGEAVSLPVLPNNAKVSSDMDVVKASAYWYDSRHDGSDGGGKSGAVADVDLAVVDTGNKIVLKNDVDGADNKARVMAQNIGGRRLAVELSGPNVAGHTDPVCGANAIQVHFSFFGEDSDREAPTFDKSTGSGVYPEHL
ncbi:MAG TPA: S8 family serine peptidase, partial [Acidimicrobiales bacterium]|nr:S8 family serine peptidase [Acidimicrobiales bacterium]